MELLKEFEERVGIKCIDNGRLDKRYFWRNYKEKLIKEERFNVFVENALREKFLNPNHISTELNKVYKVLTADFFENREASDYLFTCFPIENKVNRVGATAMISAFLSYFFSSKNNRIRRHVSIFKEPVLYIAKVLAPPINFKELFYVEEALTFISPVLKSKDGFLVCDPMEERYNQKILKVLGSPMVFLSSIPSGIFDSMFISFLLDKFEEEKIGNDVLREIVETLAFLGIGKAFANYIFSYCAKSSPLLNVIVNKYGKGALKHYIVKGEKLKIENL